MDALEGICFYNILAQDKNHMLTASEKVKYCTLNLFWLMFCLQNSLCGLYTHLWWGLVPFAVQKNRKHLEDFCVLRASSSGSAASP